MSLLNVLKHLPGKHNQKRHGWRFGGAVPAGTSGAELDEYYRRSVRRVNIDLSDPGALDAHFAQRRVELEAGIRQDLIGRIKDGLEKQGLEEDDQALEFYADVMLGDKSAFRRYAPKLGLDPDMADDYTKRQRDVERQLAGERWAMEGEHTFKYAGNPAFHTFLSPKLNEIAERGPVGKDLNEAAQILQDRYGVSFQNTNNTNPNEAHEHLSWLLNMAEENPAVAKVLTEQAKRIVYMDHPQGKSSQASWEDDGSIRVYPAGSMNPSTWVHELGHGAETYAGRDLYAKFGRGERVSRYAWGNHYEDFAETWTAVVGGGIDREWMRQNAPDKLDAILAIEGVE